MSSFLFVQFLVNPSVGADSGFYLAIAKEFYTGATYFVDIGINYNPLSILLAGVPFLVSENPSYVSHLAINMVVMMGSSFLFYSILGEYVVSRLRRLSYASLFLLLCLVLDGRYVLLEPLSVFFQLLGLYIYLPYRRTKKMIRVTGVGLCIGLAFLAKQYGLFLALPVVIDLLIYDKNRFKSIGLFTTGLLSPQIVFFIYLYAHGISIYSYIEAILGKGLSLDIGTGTGAKTSFFTYPLDTLYVILFNSYLIVIPTMIWQLRKNIQSKDTIFWIVAVLSSLTILIFANYWHYYQYIIPYTLLLFIYLLHSSGTSKSWYHSTLLTSSLFLVGYSLISLPTAGRLEEQLNQAEEINQLVPKGAGVYLDGPSPSFYYLCDFKSIDLRNIGYNFPGCFYPSTILRNLDKDEYLIVDRVSKKAYQQVNPILLETLLTIDKDTFYVLKLNR